MTNGAEGVATLATPEVMGRARRHAEAASCGKDQVIFHHGHRPIGLHIVLRGRVVLQGSDLEERGEAAATAGAGWIFSWLKDPRRYRPDTIEPDHGLGDAQAAARRPFYTASNELPSDRITGRPVPASCALGRRMRLLAGSWTAAIGFFE